MALMWNGECTWLLWTTESEVTDLSYTDIFPHEVQGLRSEHAELLVVDMRDPVARSQGAIEGAVAHSESIMQSLIRRRRSQPAVIVYCYHGNASRDLCQMLTGFGLEKVFNLVGGWQAWEANMSTPALSEVPSALSVWLHSHGFEQNDVDTPSLAGMTPLMQAAIEADADTVAALLEASANPHRRNPDGHHALWFACVGDDPAIVDQLCVAGCDVDNLNVNGISCAMYAASSGRIASLTALVEHGADLSLTTPDGFDALDLSSTAEVLRYLRRQTSKQQTNVSE